MAKRKTLIESEAGSADDAGVDLSKKYRPQTWDDVVGHGSVVKSMREVLESNEKHSFQLTGPSGIGKTTLARVLVNALKNKKGGGVEYREIDAATYTGIDAMRGITEWMQYQPFGKGSRKVVCIDEAHALSKAAWQSLLKAVEEPPTYGYWVFCLIEAGKIPDTIQTRCACYNLSPVSTDVLYDLVARVAEEEGFDVDEDVLSVVARQAQGSPRRALGYLTKCRAAEGREEAAELLQAAGESPEVIDLCRGLLKGNLDWARAMKILADKKDLNPEGIRIAIVCYLNAVVSGAKTKDAAGRAVEIQSAFLPGPFYASNGLAELYGCLAEVIL